MSRLACAVVAIVAAAGTAHAEERITDGTAYTLEPGEVRVDVLRSGVGLPVPRHLSGLELSTYTAGWASFLASTDAIGVAFVNAQLKASRELAPRWTAALTLAALYGQITSDDGSGHLLVLPLEAHVNYRLARRLTLGGLLQYTRLSAGGDARSEMTEPDRYSFEAAARTDNAHLGATAELRAAGWLSLVTEARLTYFGRISAAGEGTYQIDDNTTVDVMGEASGALPRWGWSVRGLLHWTIGPVNLRTGVSYGNYTLPMLNLAAPTKYWMPTFNLYLRF